MVQMLEPTSAYEYLSTFCSLCGLEHDAYAIAKDAYDDAGASSVYVLGLHALL